MTRVLITNDDGIDAEGLAALKKMAQQLGFECWVVAPCDQMSEIGHRVTTQGPVFVEQRGEQAWAVTGSPADCVRVALYHLPLPKLDWVWSGINHGGNLGRHDFVISGTMAAAREAAFAGLPSIAFSHYLARDQAVDWEVAQARAALACQDILQHPIKAGSFWSVNLPHPSAGAAEPRLVHCPQEPTPLDVVFEEVAPGELHYRGRYQRRGRSSGTDVDVCFGGDIAISQVQI